MTKRPPNGRALPRGKHPKATGELLDGLPPEADDAERHLLVCVLSDPRLMNAVCDIVGAEHFRDERHQILFGCLQVLQNNRVPFDDISIVIDALKKRNQLAQAGGVAYIGELFDPRGRGAPSDAPYLAEIVAEKSKRRALLRLGERALVLAHGNGEITDAHAELRELLGPVNRQAAGGVVLRCLGDIPAETLEWLWPGRIPMGKLTLIAGDPGLGKSLLTLDIATRITRGWCWPDGEERTKQGSIIILSAEDDVADTIRVRLEAMGADVSRVHVLEAVQVVTEDENGKKSSHKRTFSLELDVSALREAVAHTSACRLIIIDPISAYLGTTDSHKNADVRGALTPVVEMAQQSRTAIVGVTHLNKNAAASALHRTMGSLAFVAAARSAWAVVRDKTDPTRRLFLPIKMNLAKDSGGLSYSITDVGGVPILAWSPGAVTIPVDEAMSPDDERRDAKRWLQEILADGPVESKVVQKGAKDAGHAWRTIMRAKSDLKVVSEKEGFGSGARWLWSLPSEGGHEECHEPPSQNVASFASFQPSDGTDTQH